MHHWYRELFRCLDDGQSQDIITRNEEAPEYQRDNTFYAGLNARYQKDKNYLIHGIAVQWLQNPGSGSTGEVEYIPAVINSTGMRTSNTARNLSPNLEGNYYFKFNPKWALTADWNISYSHNNNMSVYQDLGYEPIVTNIKENVWRGQLNTVTSWQIVLNKTYLQFFLGGKLNSYDLTYTGNTDSQQTQYQKSADLSIKWFFAPSALIFQIQPRLSIISRNVNGSFKQTDIIPTVEGDIWYTINNKNSLNMQLFYNQMNPSSSMTNDLILRQTELKWIEGNRSLKPSELYLASLNYNGRPTRWLSINQSVTFNRRSDESLIIYYSGGEKYPGVIGKYADNVPEQRFSTNTSLRFMVLDGKLVFFPGLTFAHNNVKGIAHMNYVRGRVMLSWRFGNCMVMGYYSTPQKNLSHGGRKYTRMPWDCYFSFRYGYKNLICSLDLKDIFRKYSYEDILFRSGPYNYDIRKYDMKLFLLIYVS